jgi:hypothetical protein
MESLFTASRESQVPLDWLQQTRHILGRLTESLETTIDCWDNFSSEDLFATPHGQQSLATIHQTFSEAKNCLKQLQNIHKRCDEFEKTVCEEQCRHKGAIHTHISDSGIFITSTPNIVSLIFKLKWLRVLRLLATSYYMSVLVSSMSISRLTTFIMADSFTRHTGSRNTVYARESDSWHSRAQQAVFLHIDTCVGGPRICSI